MLEMKPWDLEPDLALDRLVWVAQQFVAVRKEAVADYSPGKGDIRWNHGCTCYARQMTAISRAAVSGDFPWLRVLDDSLKFKFAIGRIPLRFYRGDAENPSLSLREAFPELRARQRSLAIGQMSILPANDVSQLAWLFAVETDDIGLVTRVSVAAFSVAEDLVVSYEIPLDEAGVAPIPSIPPPAPVPIPPPLVSAPAEKKRTSADTTEGDE